MTSQVQRCCRSSQKPSLVWPLLRVTLAGNCEGTLEHIYSDLCEHTRTTTTLHFTGINVCVFHIQQIVL